MCKEKQHRERAYGKYKRSVAWQYKKRADRSDAATDPEYGAGSGICGKIPVGDGGDSGGYCAGAEYGLYLVPVGDEKIVVPVIGSVLQITIRVALSYLWIGVMGLKAVALATGIGWMAIVVYQILTYRCLKRRSNSR